MSGAIFGGDEIGAIVIDMGGFSTRAGYAGQDRPEIDIPTIVGYVENEETIDEQTVKKRKPICGVNKINTVSDNIELEFPIKEGIVNDWVAYEALISHIFSNELFVKPEEHPILVSEQIWNDTRNRDILSELMFEKFGVPAFYVATSPVLSAFAHAKSTALVIDSGHDFTSVTPVVDGYALKKNSVNIPIAANLMIEQSVELFKRLNIEIIPHYMVAKKEITPDGLPAIFTLKNIPKVRESWHNYMVKNVIQDFYSSVFQVSDSPITPGANFRQTSAYYEFPNGYYRSFNDERFLIPELLFNPINIKSISGSSSLGVHNVAINCALSCEVDIRGQLLNNIAVVGGTTLLSGYMDRLQRSLASTIPPNMKHKVLNNSYAGERRFTSWIGGSILASMGTFHQLWISKSEYIDSGKRVLDVKCS